MIIRNDETVNVIEGDSFGTITESKINSSKLSKLFGMLSSIYKNLPESIVREYCSNAWDANKMAGREDKPIMVTLQKRPDPKLIIQDFGPGMSPDTMTNIYFNYLDSTKEDNNDFIGAFGIGGKSALAYTHTFYIDTIIDGIKYNYMFSKQSNGIPAGELISQSNTTDESGTTITIPLKESDLVEFYEAIDKQLMYFPNVFVQSDNYCFSNSYKLYDGKSFIYRTGCIVENLHMCIGNVYYPIDYSELGISEIKMNVAIKFKIGELTPTPSRESIVYSKASIKAIKDRIKDLAKEIESTIPTEQIEISSLAEYEQFYGNKDFMYKITDDISLRIPKEFISNTDFFTPGLLSKELKQVKELKELGFVTNSDGLWEMRYYGWEIVPKAITANGKMLKHNISGASSWRVSEQIKNSPIDYYTLGSCYIGYIVDYYRDKTKTILIEKNKQLTDRIKNRFIAKDLTPYDAKRYFIAFSGIPLYRLKQGLLRNVEKKNWRRVLDILYSLNSEYINSTYEHYDKIEAPEHFSSAIKREESFARKKVKSAQITGYISHETLSSDNAYNGYIWESKSETAVTILKYARNVIYVEKSDRTLAKSMMHIMDKFKFSKPKYREKTYTIVCMAKRNAKDLGLQSLNDLINGDSKFIRKLSTGFMVYDMVGTLDSSSLSSALFKASPYYFELYDKVLNYCLSYGKYWQNVSDVKKAVLEAVKINGNYDKDVLMVAKEFNLAYKKISMLGDSIEMKDYRLNKMAPVILVRALKSLNIPINHNYYTNPIKIINK